MHLATVGFCVLTKEFGRGRPHGTIRIVQHCAKKLPVYIVYRSGTQTDNKEV